MLYRVFAILLIFTLITSCALFNSDSSKEKEIKALRQLQKESALHKRPYWAPYSSKKLTERIFDADSTLIEYLNRANRIDGFPETVKPVNLTEKERQIFASIIKTLPKRLYGFTERHLKGVFIVESLGGSGLTDGVFYEKETSFMVFDRKVFNKKANDWCTWKEHSVFKKGATSLKCIIRTPKENTEKEAFQFIFMHELAHVVNRGFKEYLPFWEDDIPKSFDNFPYLKISWKLEEKKMARQLTNDPFKEVRFYSENLKLPNDKIAPLYQALQSSGFPSLYGTINAFDDFAEAFVIYYHTQILKKPYEMHIAGPKGRMVFKSCLQENTCPQKEKLMKDLFYKKL